MNALEKLNAANANGNYVCIGLDTDLNRIPKHLLKEKMEMLKIDSAFVERSLHVGFSGGEKKRAEVLQMAILQPKFIILDEIDSGLDIDALNLVCNKINFIKNC